jgi:hypothetical protein
VNQPLTTITGIITFNYTPILTPGKGGYAQLGSAARQGRLRRCWYGHGLAGTQTVLVYGFLAE